MGDSNVNMICKRNHIFKAARHDLETQQAIEPLKPLQKVGLACRFKLEEIWEIDIRIQHN
jgi:hypothetical protein